MISDLRSFDWFISSKRKFPAPVTLNFKSNEFFLFYQSEGKSAEFQHFWESFQLSIYFGIQSEYQVRGVVMQWVYWQMTVSKMNVCHKKKGWMGLVLFPVYQYRRKLNLNRELHWHWNYITVIWHLMVFLIQYITCMYLLIQKYTNNPNSSYEII